MGRIVRVACTEGLTQESCMADRLSNPNCICSYMKHCSNPAKNKGTIALCDAIGSNLHSCYPIGCHPVGELLSTSAHKSCFSAHILPLIAVLQAN